MNAEDWVLAETCESVPTFFPETTPLVPQKVSPQVYRGPGGHLLGFTALNTHLFVSSRKEERENSSNSPILRIVMKWLLRYNL